MKKVWHDKAWEEYVYWQTHDKKILKKINDLLKDIERNGANYGIGKPEALKGNRQGFFSRRIDEENRLVYNIENGNLNIMACKGHYDD